MVHTLDRTAPARVLRLAALWLPALVAVGCQSAEEEAADLAESARAARADSVAAAEAQFDPAGFDTVTWETPEARLERGQVVWRFSCLKCHGAGGRGDGELAAEHQLVMPEILAADWEYAGDIPAIRHRVYVGHESEMPTWGLYGLTYRDIDAVAHHLDQGLRDSDPE